MTRHYPDVPIAAIQAIELIRQHLAEDPSYLAHPECPYPGEFKRLFVQLLSTPGGPALPTMPDEDGDDLEANTKRVFKELNDYGRSLGAGDSAEKAAYFRLSATLLDKLISMQERAQGLRRQQEFENLILEFLENEVGPDVRTKLMDRLKDGSTA
jgi:hypothetical protein